MGKILSVLGLIVLGAVVAVGAMWMTGAGTHHGAKMSGHTTGHGAGHGAMAGAGIPVEAGQSAFAALAEIVELLQRDHETNWSEVQLTSLRDHLVDMNALILETRVEQENIEHGVQMTVTGTTAALEAAGRMIPAHSKMLEKGQSLITHFESSGPQARWTVTAKDSDLVTRIRGLGFYGLMASGAHHQPHHLAIATGKPMHAGH